jgi:hypothetical protein
MGLNVQDLNSQITAAGINGVSDVEPAYLPVAEEMGLYAADSADNSALSGRFRSRGAVSPDEDDSGYIYNLRQYDPEGKVAGNTDSYYLVSYNSEGAFISEAFGYSALSGGYNSVDTYIDPFDPEIARLLDSIPGLNDPKLTTDEKLVRLYNYIINNFNYVAESKDNWNFVSETIYQRGGDCEDLSILLASAMISLLMQEGFDYQTANGRVSAVAGQHAVYGDHVFVEYLAEDGNTYVLDAAFAEQGNIKKLSELKQVKDLNFSVYFRFNDNKAFGSAPVSGANKTRAYIDPQQECLQKIMDQFEQEVDLHNVTPDELAIKLFNFLKSEFQYVDTQDLILSMEQLVNIKAGSSQGLTLLYTNLLLAMSARLELPLPNVRLREAERDGEKQYVIIYEDTSGVDRVFDFTDKIVDPLLQISLLNSVKDMLSISCYIPAAELGALVKYGQEYSLDNNLYNREVQRFNPNAGYVSDSTQSTHDSSDSDTISDYFESEMWIPGVWSGGTSAEEAKRAANRMRPGRNSVDWGAFYNGNFYQNNQYETQRAIADMANFGNYIDTSGDFWTFNDLEFEKARARLLFQRAMLSLMAMLVEAENESYNIVAAELEWQEEGYKSMKASQIIQAETDYLIKGVNELKKEAVGIVTQHNQLMEAILTKEKDSLQQSIDRLIMVNGMAATGAATIAAALAGGLSSAGIGISFGLMAAVLTFPAGAALLVLSLIAQKLGSASIGLVTSLQTLAQDTNRALFANQKLFEIADPRKSATEKNLKNAEYSAYSVLVKRGLDTYLASSRGKTSLNAISSNFAQQYAILETAASKVNFISISQGMIYDDDETFLLLERELAIKQGLNRLLVSLHSAKANSRNAVHMEMTSKSGYTSSSLPQAMIEQEQSIIMEKFNELKQLRQEYISAHNQRETAKANADRLTAKAIVNTVAFALGLTTTLVGGPGPEMLMSLAGVVFNLVESSGLWDRDDKRAHLDTDRLLDSSSYADFDVSDYAGGRYDYYAAGSFLYGTNLFDNLNTWISSGSVINFGTGGNRVGASRASSDRSRGAVSIDPDNVATAGMPDQNKDRRPQPDMVWDGYNISNLNPELLQEFIRLYNSYSLNGTKLTLNNREMSDAEREYLRLLINNQYIQNDRAVSGLSSVTVTKRTVSSPGPDGSTIYTSYYKYSEKRMTLSYVTQGVKDFVAARSDRYRLEGNTLIYIGSGENELSEEQHLAEQSRLAAEEQELRRVLAAERDQTLTEVDELWHNSNFRFRVATDGLTADDLAALDAYTGGQFYYDPETKYLYLLGTMTQDTLDALLGQGGYTDEAGQYHAFEARLSAAAQQAVKSLYDQSRKKLTAEDEKDEETGEYKEKDKYLYAPKIIVGITLSAANLAYIKTLDKSVMYYDESMQALVIFGDLSDEQKRRLRENATAERSEIDDLIKNVEAMNPKVPDMAEENDKARQALLDEAGLDTGGGTDADSGTFTDPTNYRMLYRARIAKMRLAALELVNLKRAVYMIRRYELESRNIVHQEMTNATTYQVSNNAESLLSAEYQYVTSVIAAYASREEQRVQVNNAILERTQQREKSLLTGIASQIPLGLSFLVNMAYDGLNKDSYYNIDPSLNNSVNNSGLGRDTDSTGIDISRLDASRSAVYGGGAGGNTADDQVNVYGDNAKYQDSESGNTYITRKKAGNFLGIDFIQVTVNFDKLQEDIKKIYSGMYLNAVLQSLYSAKSASRSMVHQILTNISNLTLSGYASNAIGAENQFITQKASDLSANVSDLAALKQKHYDAVQAFESTVMKGIASSVGAAAIATLTIAFSASPIPDIFGIFKMCSAISGVINSIFDLLYSIVQKVALDDLAKKEAEESYKVTVRGKQAMQKNSTDDEGNETTEEETIYPEVNTNGVNSTTAAGAKFQLGIVQANMKKMERVQAALRKLARAKGESRSKISAKISGIGGAQITNAAEMVAGLEAGLAEALIGELIKQAQNNESLEAKADAQFDQIMGGVSSLVSSSTNLYTTMRTFKDRDYKTMNGTNAKTGRKTDNPSSFSQTGAGQTLNGLFGGTDSPGSMANTLKTVMGNVDTLFNGKDGEGGAPAQAATGFKGAMRDMTKVIMAFVIMGIKLTEFGANILTGKALNFDHLGDRDGGGIPEPIADEIPGEPIKPGEPPPIPREPEPPAEPPEAPVAPEAPTKPAKPGQPKPPEAPVAPEVPVRPGEPQPPTPPVPVEIGAGTRTETTEEIVSLDEVVFKPGLGAIDWDKTLEKANAGRAKNDKLTMDGVKEEVAAKVQKIVASGGTLTVGINIMNGTGGWLKDDGGIHNGLTASQALGNARIDALLNAGGIKDKTAVNKEIVACVTESGMAALNNMPSERKAAVMQAAGLPAARLEQTAKSTGTKVKGEMAERISKGTVKNSITTTSLDMEALAGDVGSALGVDMDVDTLKAYCADKGIDLASVEASDPAAVRQLGEQLTTAVNGDRAAAFNASAEMQDYTAAMQDFGEAMDKYNADKAQYDEDKAQYDTDKAQYDTDLEQYNSDMTAYGEAMDKYNADLEQYNTDKAQYDADLEQYNSDMAARGEAVEKYNKDKAQYDIDKEKYDSDVIAYGEAMDKYNADVEKYNTDKAAYDAAMEARGAKTAGTEATIVAEETGGTAEAVQEKQSDPAPAPQPNGTVRPNKTGADPDNPTITYMDANGVPFVGVPDGPPGEDGTQNYKLYAAASMDGDRPKEGAESVGFIAGKTNDSGGQSFSGLKLDPVEARNEAWRNTVDSILTGANYLAKAVADVIKERAAQRQLKEKMQSLSGMGEMLAALDPRDARDVISTLADSYMSEGGDLVAKTEEASQSLKTLWQGGGWDGGAHDLKGSALQLLSKTVKAGKDLGDKNDALRQLAGAGLAGIAVNPPPDNAKAASKFPDPAVRGMAMNSFANSNNGYAYIQNKLEGQKGTETEPAVDGLNAPLRDLFKGSPSATKVNETFMRVAALDLGDPNDNSTQSQVRQILADAGITLKEHKTAVQVMEQVEGIRSNLMNQIYESRAFQKEYEKIEKSVGEAKSQAAGNVARSLGYTPAKAELNGQVLDYGVKINTDGSAEIILPPREQNYTQEELTAVAQHAGENNSGIQDGKTITILHKNTAGENISTEFAVTVTKTTGADGVQTETRTITPRSAPEPAGGEDTSAAGAPGRTAQWANYEKFCKDYDNILDVLTGESVQYASREEFVQAVLDGDVPGVTIDGPIKDGKGVTHISVNKDLVLGTHLDEIEKLASGDGNFVLDIKDGAGNITERYDFNRNTIQRPVSPERRAEIDAKINALKNAEPKGELEAARTDLENLKATRASITSAEDGSTEPLDQQVETKQTELAALEKKNAALAKLEDSKLTGTGSQPRNGILSGCLNTLRKSAAGRFICSAADYRATRETAARQVNFYYMIRNPQLQAEARELAARQENYNYERAHIGRAVQEVTGSEWAPVPGSGNINFAALYTNTQMEGRDAPSLSDPEHTKQLKELKHLEAMSGALDKWIEAYAGKQPPDPETLLALHTLRVQVHEQLAAATSGTRAALPAEIARLEKLPDDDPAKKELAGLQTKLTDLTADTAQLFKNIEDSQLDVLYQQVADELAGAKDRNKLTALYQQITALTGADGETGSTDSGTLTALPEDFDPIQWAKGIQPRQSSALASDKENFLLEQAASLKLLDTAGEHLAKGSELLQAFGSMLHDTSFMTYILNQIELDYQVSGLPPKDHPLSQQVKAGIQALIEELQQELRTTTDPERQKEIRDILEQLSDALGRFGEITQTRSQNYVENFVASNARGSEDKNGANWRGGVMANQLASALERAEGLRLNRAEMKKLDEKIINLTTRLSSDEPLTPAELQNELTRLAEQALRAAGLDTRSAAKIADIMQSGSVAELKTALTDAGLLNSPEAGESWQAIFETNEQGSYSSVLAFLQNGNQNDLTADALSVFTVKGLKLLSGAQAGDVRTYYESAMQADAAQGGLRTHSSDDLEYTFVSALLDKHFVIDADDPPKIRIALEQAYNLRNFMKGIYADISLAKEQRELIIKYKLGCATNDDLKKLAEFSSLTRDTYGLNIMKKTDLQPAELARLSLAGCVKEDYAYSPESLLLSSNEVDSAGLAHILQNDPALKQYEAYQENSRIRAARHSTGTEYEKNRNNERDNVAELRALLTPDRIQAAETRWAFDNEVKQQDAARLTRSSTHIGQKFGGKLEQLEDLLLNRLHKQAAPPRVVSQGGQTNVSFTNWQETRDLMIALDGAGDQYENKDIYGQYTGLQNYAADARDMFAYLEGMGAPEASPLADRKADGGYGLDAYFSAAANLIDALGDMLSKAGNSLSPAEQAEIKELLGKTQVLLEQRLQHVGRNIGISEVLSSLNPGLNQVALAALEINLANEERAAYQRMALADYTASNIYDKAVAVNTEGTNIDLPEDKAKFMENFGSGFALIMKNNPQQITAGKLLLAKTAGADTLSNENELQGAAYFGEAALTQIFRTILHIEVEQTILPQSGSVEAINSTIEGLNALGSDLFEPDSTTLTREAGAELQRLGKAIADYINGGGSPDNLAQMYLSIVVNFTHTSGQSVLDVGADHEEVAAGRGNAFKNGLLDALTQESAGLSGEQASAVIEKIAVKKIAGSGDQIIGVIAGGKMTIHNWSGADLNKGEVDVQVYSGKDASGAKIYKTAAVKYDQENGQWLYNGKPCAVEDEFAKLQETRSAGWELRPQQNAYQAERTITFTGESQELEIPSGNFKLSAAGADGRTYAAELSKDAEQTGRYILTIPGQAADAAPLLLNAGESIEAAVNGVVYTVSLPADGGQPLFTISGAAGRVQLGAASYGDAENLMAFGRDNSADQLAAGRIPVEALQDKS